MKNAVILTITFISIALGILVFLYWQSSPDALQISSNENSTNTIPFERTWATEPLVEIPINNQINDSLLRPVEFDSFNGTLYVTDYGDMKIKQFTTDGEYIDQFGEFIGRGPEDFIGPLDIFVSENDLYVTDRDLVVKIFDLKTTELNRTLKLEQYSDELIRLNESLVVMGTTDYKYFTVYDNNDSLDTYFGGIVEGHQKDVISFDGFLIPSNKNEEFIYIPRYGSYLFYYTLDGKNTKTVQTIDRFEIPKSIQLETGLRAPSPDQIIHNIAYTDSYLLIQNSRKSIKDHPKEEFRAPHSYIDIYSISGDRYFETILLPYYTDGIAVVDDFLFLMNANMDTIQKYELPEFE
ncbi:MAG: hypothetical protein ABJH08_08650 [Balneola sp.]